MSSRLQFRRGSAATWTAVNPVLTAGEPGFETSTGFEKRGDGSTPWAALNYFVPASLPQAGDTGPSLPVGSFVASPSWGAAHAMRDGNKDGIFYVQAFTDASGSNSPMTFNNPFGISMTKTGPGSVNAHWGRIIHQGSGQAGLFIGDVTADAAGLAGDIWGGDFAMIFNVAANSTGLRILMTPNVPVNGVNGKSQQALLIANSVDLNPITQGIRILGNFVNPIVHYSDAAGTIPILFTTMNGDLNMAGLLAPITSGASNLGSTVKKWGSAYLSGTLFAAAAGSPTVGGGSGGVYIGNAVVNPTSPPSIGGFMFVDPTSNALSWYGADGTNGKLLIGSAAGPARPTRSLATVYQPSSTRPTLVVITVTPSAGSGATGGVKILCDAANPPTTEVTRASIGQAGGTAPPTIAANIPLVFVVAPGFFYEIVNLGGSPANSDVTEYTL